MSNSGKMIGIGIAALVILVVLGTLFSGCTGHNDLQSYQLKQGLGGDVEIIDAPGMYMKNFATIYTYPRSVQAFYSQSPKEGTPEDESISVHFNDGGTAKISVMVQFQMPSDAEKRKHVHQTFGGVDGVKQAVRAHLINCVKNTGPMMSATENQAARKGEFNQVVEEQLRKGIYAMRRVEVELTDRTTAPATPTTLPAGAPSVPVPTPVKVWATEIVNDAKTGQPLIVEKSPLDDYGITIQQFSITGTDYDDATKQQFAAKQQSFLKGEQSKAQRESELQQTLMIQQQGLRQQAEVEASENVKKTQQVIQAKALAEVAEQTKKQAETLANQQVSVAELTKTAAETKAKQEAEIQQIAAEQQAKVQQIAAEQQAKVQQISAEQQLKVAELAAQEAEQKAKAVRTLADAEAEKIAKAGSLSETARLQMELDSKTKIGVAEALSKVNVPSTIITGPGGEGKEGVSGNLTNILLLKSMGYIKDQPGEKAGK